MEDVGEAPGVLGEGAQGKGVLNVWIIKNINLNNLRQNLNIKSRININYNILKEDAKWTLYELEAKKTMALRKSMDLIKFH